VAQTGAVPLAFRVQPEARVASVHSAMRWLLQAG